MEYFIAPYKDFIDYHSDEIMNGVQYWKSMDEVFRDYFNHPEAKFDGTTGILDRKHIHLDKIIHIGKESNKLEETNVLGVDEDGYQLYGPIQDDQDFRDMILHVSEEMAIKFKISRSECHRLRKQVREGLSLNIDESTREKILALIHAHKFLQGT